MHLQDFLTPQMIGTLISACLAVFTALAAYGTSLLKVYLASKTTANQWDFVKSQAATAVKWLEQSPAFSGQEGAKKKEIAIMYMLDIAEKAGIPMDHTVADKLIEEAVHDMKSTVSDFFGLEAPEPGPVIMPETAG
jgi:LL-H family phage holin